MPRPPKDTTQLTLKVPSEWIQEFDDLAEVMAKPGATMSRSDALRVALHRGKTELCAEYADALKEVRKSPT
jgi:hypothetical protein